MIYCDKCARILDEDVQFCPICNDEDPNWQDMQKEPDTVDIQSRVFRGEAFDKLREINQHLEENPYQEQEPVKRPVYEDKPSAGLYIAMILLSTCLSFVGLIVGIVYATNRNKHYQALGIMILIISVVFLLSGVILWVAIVALAGM